MVETLTLSNSTIGRGYCDLMSGKLRIPGAVNTDFPWLRMLYSYSINMKHEGLPGTGTRSILRLYDAPKVSRELPRVLVGRCIGELPWMHKLHKQPLIHAM